MYLSLLYICWRNGWRVSHRWTQVTCIFQNPKLTSGARPFWGAVTRKDCSAVLCDHSHETVFPVSSLSCFSLGFSILPSMKSGYEHNAVIFLQLIIQFSLQSTEKEGWFILIFKKEKVNNSNNNSYLSVYGHTNSSQSVSFISTNMPGRLQKGKEKIIWNTVPFEVTSQKSFNTLNKPNNWVIYRDFFKVCSPRRALTGSLGRGLPLRLSNLI